MVALRIRSALRRRIPYEARQLLAEGRRRCRDTVHGANFSTERGGADWPVFAEIAQRISAGPFHANKVANLKRAVASIDGGVIRQGAHWSFWHQVGRPSASNGYLEGRTIVDGQLVRQVGGGLCQLSSLVYHLALLGGLAIVERHPHSIDIYHEDDRYMPLGSDATVVWGFKDLRFANAHTSPIAITFEVDDSRLAGRLHSVGNLGPRKVGFVHARVGNDRVAVETVVDGVTLHVAEYVQRPGMTTM